MTLLHFNRGWPFGAPAISDRRPPLGCVRILGRDRGGLVPIALSDGIVPSATDDLEAQDLD